MTTMYEEFLKYLTIDNGLFISVVFIGMLGHAIKKYLAKELSGSIIDYLFFRNKKRSALAIFTAFGTAVGIILGEQLPTQIGAFLILAFTTGFTADSTVNTDEIA